MTWDKNKPIEKAFMTWWIDRRMIVQGWKREEGQDRQPYWHRPCPGMTYVTLYSSKDPMGFYKIKPNKWGDYFVGISFRKLGHNGCKGSIIWPKEQENAARDIQQEAKKAESTRDRNDSERIGHGFGHDW